ncbi:hypothetical protein [Gaetbulibacter jejuensis]|uniref:Lipoprotein n=1 Tax=Gaetbulibacter jejuensis TaxID=584607 RepID=A0ABP3UZ79_9FLAO
MKSIFKTLLLIALLSSCGNKSNNKTTHYIGAYRIMDQMVPYPYIVKQNSDSLYLFNNSGLLIDRTEGERIEKNKTIEFKEKHFNVLNRKKDNFYAFDLLDTLNFRPFKNGAPNPKNSVKFVQIQSDFDIDIRLLKNDFKNTIWEYNVVEDENSNPNKDLEIKQTIKVKEDSLYVLTDYYYQGIKTVSEFETKSYNLFKIDSICFLSFQKEENNPQTIFQIVEHRPGKIDLRDFSSSEIKDISYYKSSFKEDDYVNSISNANKYSNCFDGYQGEYYFGDDVTFNKGNQFLIDYVSKNAPITEDKSGYIIVQFTINCNGDVGHFGLIQMDRDFKKMSFQKEIIKHILSKVSTLNDFPSSYSQIEWLDYKDIHAFLMFKLHNGKIVDLCP